MEIKNVHKFNQLIEDNGINLPKTKKTLFVCALLLTLKINPEFINSQASNGCEFIEKHKQNIADRMIKTINEYYKDTAFIKPFEFIKTSLNNHILSQLFKLLDFNLKNTDILNLFYCEFNNFYNLYNKNEEVCQGVD